MSNTILYLLPFFLFVLIASSEESQSTCSVTFFWDQNYAGSQFTLTGAVSINDLSISNPSPAPNGWNDQISSIRINNVGNSNCNVHCCFNSYCNGGASGGSTDIMFNQAYVGDHFNDQFSSLYITVYSPTDPYVVFFKSCLYSVDYQWFVNLKGKTSPAYYFANDIGVNDIGNDALSAVYLPSSTAVILYSDNSDEGNSMALVGPNTGTCFTAYPGWNDVTSSLIVYDITNGAFPSPVGYWVLVDSNGYLNAINHVLNFGYTTTDTTTNSASLTSQITDSIEAGVEFAKETTTVSISATISTQVSGSVQESASETCTMVCAANTCSSGITYLYVWNMSFQHPWNSSPNPDVSLVTCNAVCRCTNTPPQCPLGACADAFCNTCIPGWHS